MPFNLIELSDNIFRGFLTLGETLMNFFLTEFNQIIDPTLLPEQLQGVTILDALLGAPILVILIIGVVKFLT